MTAPTSTSWKLSPSDLTFLWEECPRCFYQKVALGLSRPRSPMPSIFNKIDSLEKTFFAGLRTETISPALPPGVIELGDKWIESHPIVVPGHNATCFIRGRFDVVAWFHDGSYGIIDFKTSTARESNVPFYSRQLHAYMYALEQAAPGKLKLAPVSRMGLLCVDPVEMAAWRGNYIFKMAPTWIECPRDDDGFLGFLGQVLDILQQPKPPNAGSSCQYCQYAMVA